MSKGKRKKRSRYPSVKDKTIIVVGRQIYEFEPAAVELFNEFLDTLRGPQKRLMRSLATVAKINVCCAGGSELKLIPFMQLYRAWRKTLSFRARATLFFQTGIFW